MSMNSEIHFSQIPGVEKQRSRFDRSSEYKTSYNTGDLIPAYVDEVLPGDTITMDFNHVTRMTTPIAPVMDEAAMDVYAFFVPCRLIWNHWREFWGENNTTHWEQPVEYEIPSINAPTGGWLEGSLADYLGVPIGVELEGVNHLPFRAYAKIVNDWFRDENLKDPCYITMDETTVTGKNKGLNYDYVTDIECGAAPFKVAKWHDYFTSALPEPQKGPDVKIPLGTSAPVVGGPDIPNTFTLNETIQGKPIFSYNKDGGTIGNVSFTGGTNADGTQVTTENTKAYALVTDLSDATAATINQLRQAFAVQRFYEAQARGGSRYIEFIKNIFGVTSPDARQQRSEYLGGKRFPINMDQVLQTSATDLTSPQGNTAAFSCTINSDNLFTYSATEHGYLFVLTCIRTNHSYQQGLNKMWLRKKWTDFYVPQFANLGEMPIYNAEIYAQDSDVVDADTGEVVNEQVFGYQEAWAEYRYKPNMITGKLRSTATGSLDLWHYADYYTQLPKLSGEWIDETESNVQRTLAVQSEPQFIMDSYFKSTWTRVMPLYSVPGLLDHH